MSKPVRIFASDLMPGDEISLKGESCYFYGLVLYSDWMQIQFGLRVGGPSGRSLGSVVLKHPAREMVLLAAAELKNKGPGEGIWEA